MPRHLAFAVAAVLLTHCSASTANLDPLDWQKVPGSSVCSGLGVMGRLARSVAIITQRPTIGSLRSSGIGKLRRSLAKKSCSSCIYTFHIICSKFGPGQARLIVPSRGARSRLWRPSDTTSILPLHPRGHSRLTDISAPKRPQRAHTLAWQLFAARQSQPGGLGLLLEHWHT